MKITDEILNKYIDGELSRKEINELQQLIKVDEEALAMLKAHKLVDQILRKLETESAPESFTENVMNRIFETLTVKNKTFPLFRIIVSTFGLMIIGIIAYVVSAIPSNSPENKIVDGVLDRASDYTSGIFSFIVDALSNNTILMVIAGVSLIVLLSAYFMFESHKSFKEKLKGF